MKRIHVNPACLLALVASAMAWTNTARAQDASNIPARIGRLATASQVDARVASATQWTAVGNNQLEAARGGFDAGNGLLASFGIERLVYVNGDLVARTSVNIPDVARMTTAQASALAAVTTNVGLVQNGTGNTFTPSTLSHAAAMVIQNSLDNQNIRSLTVIDASVNGVNQFQAARLADSLQTALIGSLGH